MIRLFLKRVDEYAMYEYGPPQFTFLDIEQPQIEALLCERPAWWILGAELINDQADLQRARAGGPGDDNRPEP
jgi:hypothetical protein